VLEVTVFGANENFVGVVFANVEAEGGDAAFAAAVVVVGFFGAAEDAGIVGGCGGEGIVRG